MMNTQETKFSSAMRNNARKHFRNEDLQAGVDFETALRLGCFDKEFTYYSVAYDTRNGIVCRVSAKEKNIQQFVQYAAEENLLPTPVRSYRRRLPAPSGREDQIKTEVKKEAARNLFAVYPDAYFQCLSELSKIEARDGAQSLLQEWQEELDGLYDPEQLALYQGLLCTALESKQLTMKSYLQHKDWLRRVERQLENDIIPKGQYKKTITAFAYSKDLANWQYFFDARPELTFQKKQEYTLQGYWTTPIFSRTRWLTDMNEFRNMRESFQTDYQRYCACGYLDRFVRLKQLPGVISAAEYDAQQALVLQLCPAETQTTFACYRRRWNIL